MENKKRLIDADALMQSISTERSYITPDNVHDIGMNNGLTLVQAMVLIAPTVDAVEVVRCKDCAHWYEPEGVCLKIYSDGAVSPYAWQDRTPDDFCSYGERKEK